MDRKLRKAICAGKLHDDMTFAQRVWTITSRIPAGRVATYGQIARILGGNGFRAVGMALNRNPLAPAVPCHRVVGADGSLVGFAGGLKRKRQMLLDEGVLMVKGKVVMHLCQYADTLLKH